MPRPFSEALTTSQRRVAEALAQFERMDRPGLVPDLVSSLKLSGEGGITATLQRMARNGFVEIQGGGARGRSRIVKLTDKGRHAVGAGGLPLLGAIPAGLLSEAIEQPTEFLNPGTLLNTLPGDLLLRVAGDSMVGDGIFHGDLVHLRPSPTVPHKAIAAVCVGEDREGTLKRILHEGSKVRLRASNPVFEDVVVPAETVRVVGVLKGVIRHVGSGE